MQIEIYPPNSLWEKGKRPKNEDSVYPHTTPITSGDKTFLVCDGVGGAAKGEVASQLVANTFGEVLKTRVANTENLHETLEKVQTEIDNYILSNENHKGMGTTLTFLQLNDYGAIIAHAGDSRVYHFRGTEILFCTSDHSLVNELRKKGLEKEAKLAGDNIITRAIQGSTIKKIELDVHITNDIQPDDYFLLCSDGVWGVIPDDRLIAILTQDTSDTEKIKVIDEICKEYSRDNYSAYLIKIKEVSTNNPTENTIPIVATTSSNKQSAPPNIVVENTRKNGFSWVAILFSAIIFGGIGFTLWNNYFKTDPIESVAPSSFEEEIKLEEILKEVIKEKETLNLTDTLSANIKNFRAQEVLSEKSFKKRKRIKSQKKSSKSPEDNIKQKRAESTPPLPIIIPKVVSQKDTTKS